MGLGEQPGTRPLSVPRLVDGLLFPHFGSRALDPIAGMSHHGDLCLFRREHIAILVAQSRTPTGAFWVRVLVRSEPPEQGRILEQEAAKTGDLPSVPVASPIPGHSSRGR